MTQTLPSNCSTLLVPHSSASLCSSSPCQPTHFRSPSSSVRLLLLCSTSFCPVSPNATSFFRLRPPPSYFSHDLSLHLPISSLTFSSHLITTSHLTARVDLTLSPTHRIVLSLPTCLVASVGTGGNRVPGHLSFPTHFLN